MVRLRDMVGHSQTHQGFRSTLNLLTHAFKFPFILNIIFKLESQLPHTTLIMNEMFYTCTSDGSFILVTNTPSTLFPAESTWVGAITLCSILYYFAFFSISKAAINIFGVLRICPINPCAISFLGKFPISQI